MKDKLRRKIRPVRRQRENKMETEGEIALTISDAELASLEGTNREDKMAKLLIQMIWHRKSVSRIQKHDTQWKVKEVKEGQHECLTAQMKTEWDSQAIRAVLRQLKASLREPDWKQWPVKH